MERKEGQISVNTENIFPVIRKWLYSDQDIFLRELVSNGTDAISKFKRLVQLGEAEADANEAYRIDVILDTDQHTLTVSDNGLGMTADEIDKYINQIAYSGAVNFLEQYKDKGDEGAIIGHFGLGFYSAFMVSSQVVINTKSYRKEAPAARWTSAEGMEFVLEAGDRAERGTDIILNLNEEAQAELTGYKVRDILHKYCEFMPYEIYFTDVVSDREQKADREKHHKEEVAAWEKRKAEALEKKEDFTEAEPTLYEPAEAGPVNHPHPLWQKAPKDCTDEEYKAFYRDTFQDYREPLFWIHLNMDYPFHVQGILYFPQAENTYETLDGRIKLYSNQVFVADNIKEVIPDFLFLLKGCIDAPDLPLNVSRSFLQNDSYVKKLSEHIVRKVADRLTKMFEKEREIYNGYWKDLAVFVKYGCLREAKFYDRMKDALLFETTEGEFKTAKELGEKIWYTTDKARQVAYIKRAADAGHTVVIMDHELDNPFMSMLEQKQSPLKFVRIDSEVDAAEGVIEHQATFEKLFRRISGQEKLTVKVKAMGEDGPAAVLTESEESRRSQEMRKQFERMQGKNSGMDFDSMFPVEQTLVVNTDSPLAAKLRSFADIPAQKEQGDEIARQLYDLARLSHGSLTGQDLANFLSRSTRLLNDLN
ncbi:MAG: molecular chaperone HtpG [Oscillospiraceae bacterium]|nr:molecular chaperone HtpG [Oscillospiraceae bacterium]MDD4368118.1 molecular chaperone HtpG [Oscillospiraceae bacterium]